MPNDDNADDLILLTNLSRELLVGGYTDKPVDYARAYRGCLSARFPAEQNIVGRWSVRRRHLSAVAAALGLTPRRKAAAKAPRTADAEAAQPIT